MSAERYDFDMLVLTALEGGFKGLLVRNYKNYYSSSKRWVTIVLSPPGERFRLFVCCNMYCPGAGAL